MTAIKLQFTLNANTTIQDIFQRVFAREFSVFVRSVSGHLLFSPSLPSIVPDRPFGRQVRHTERLIIHARCLKARSYRHCDRTTCTRILPAQRAVCSVSVFFCGVSVFQVLDK